MLLTVQSFDATVNIVTHFISYVPEENSYWKSPKSFTTTWILVRFIMNLFFQSICLKINKTGLRIQKGDFCPHTFPL